ncbi:MAG: class I SAM-dependent RNA methyltransferase [Opitutales bacterium]
MIMNKEQPKNFVDTPFKYQEEIILDIVDLTNLGVGVGKLDNWVVFVPYALVGEKVKARVYKNHTSYSQADLVEVIEPSPDRVVPFCDKFGICGGCQYQHLSYEKQLEFKQKQIADLMERIAFIKMPIEKTHPSPKIQGYRSKLTPHYDKPRKDLPLDIGFIKQGRRRDIVDIPQCPIASDSINAALPAVRARVKANAPKRKKGATILLRDTLGGVEEDNNAVAITSVGGINYQFIAGDFFQNNPFILPEFVEYIINEARGNKYLIDAYCGVGLFSLAAAKDFQQIEGVEISAKAIACAKVNAKINNITNANFMIASSEEIFKQINFEGKDSTVIIDPPRSGSSPEFLKQLVDFAPNKIVYVSCGPDTQARDLIYLNAQGYKVTKMQPFDMFPQTRHIETVATLVRSDSES